MELVRWNLRHNTPGIFSWDIYGILWIQRIQNRKLLTRIGSLCDTSNYETPNMTSYYYVIFRIMSLKSDKSSVVCVEAVIVGNVQIGERSVIHPKVRVQGTIDNLNALDGQNEPAQGSNYCRKRTNCNRK